MVDYVASLRAFNKKFQQFELPAPGVPPHDVIELRKALITEEQNELYEAMEAAEKEPTQDNLVKVADAVADLLYVVFGTGCAFGLPTDAVFEEVQRSNMSKTPGLYAENGKTLKGPDFTPPDLKPILFPRNFDPTVSQCLCPACENFWADMQKAKDEFEQSKR